MYSQFVIKDNSFNTEQLNFQKCIIIGNWMMLFSLILVLSALTMTFGFDELFSLPVQIAGHISTIFFAGILKLGYVIRCVGVHGLGYKVF